MWAAFHITFLGTQPTFTQVPPSAPDFDHHGPRAVFRRAPRAGEPAAAAANHRQIVVVRHRCVPLLPSRTAMVHGGPRTD